MNLLRLLIIGLTLSQPMLGMLHSHPMDPILRRAVQFGSIKDVRHALKHGADPNTRIAKASNPDPKYGQSALVLATKNGHTEIVEALLEAGADVNANYGAGHDALKYAILFQNIAICQLLINAHADVNHDDGDMQYLPILLALTFGTQNICELLIDHGADVFRTYVNGATIFEILKPKHLHHVLCVPNLSQVTQSKKTILHLIWCFKQLNFRRDLHQMVLAHSNPKELSMIMIARRIAGNSIPAFLVPLTEHALYESTCTHIDDSLINPNFSSKLQATIHERLAQPKLLCNNPSQMWHIEHKEKEKRCGCSIQ